MSTYAQRVQLGPFFSGGELQGAAKLYHYAAGTSTLKNIWSDRTMVTTLAQPFVADAEGVFNFFADGLYKLIICGPDSTGPSDDVLYTLDNWKFVDPTDPTFSEGTSIPSASTIAVGPEIFFHVTGTTNIDTITGTVPFVWLVFDGNLTLNHSASLICPGGVNLSVQTGDVIFLLLESTNTFRVAGQIAGVLQVGAADVAVVAQDTRTNTVDTPLTVTSTTSGTPAAGIGVGIKYRAESADENPCDVGQTEFVTSDVTAGSEDTYFQILLRVAGAALGAAWRFVATTAFRAILTHANTADRTYTMANRSCVLGHRYDCPVSIGTGSTRTHEGSVTVSVNTTISGTHFYDDFTVNAGVTVDVTAGSRALVIIATGTITINGTITTVSGGPAGGAAGNPGNPGTDQPGGNGNGGANAGGLVSIHGCTLTTTAPTSVTGSSQPLIASPLTAMGGGSGAGGSTGTGGRGGGSLVLIAPTIVLAGTATLNTSGSNGGAANAGGGGAGNIYIIAHSFTDNGATFTQTGGSPNGTGTAGSAGIKQINIYN